uniref:Pre-mRNA cleavage complex 2 protein Pcf11 n=1 Tax=Phallusia mammillata TaxID=59560 RepID=A0A6F9DNX8_9ASCI|nr:pre-mRNA cleavage complex 2 protein Pcf11 [Phallusia mammillata]
MEPFSTSAFKVFFFIYSSTTKICTGGCSTQARALGFDARRRGPPTRRGIAHRCARTAATAGYRPDAPAPSIFRAD